MLTENYELRATARRALNGKWGTGVVMTLVYMVISVVISIIPFVGGIASLLVVLPIAWGFVVIFLKNLRGEGLEVGKMFDGFQDYGRILGTMLLIAVYTFLWTLLLVIPGIIKSYSYRMTIYVLNDQPELSFNGAIEKSMDMMKGHKMKLFLLDLSFIGWALLSIITLGIGVLWLYPYMLSASAAFYEDLKKETVPAGI